MSARQWKARLEECQKKLGDSIVAAQEWKVVATNRLELMRRLDQVLSHNLEDLVGVGAIFGVEVSLPDDVWTPSNNMDAGTIAMYVMGKLEAVAEYQKELLKQASEVQMALSDTYDLACEAVVVGRPCQDITIPLDTEQVSVPSSPYREFEAQINDIPGPSKRDSVQDNISNPGRPVKDTPWGEAGALSLFRKT